MDNPAAIAGAERAWGPLGEFVDRWAAVRLYVLELADEARELMTLL
jgi:hypothetical protein